MTNETKKAKRRLSNIDFSGEGAALSLVGPIVGGPANLTPTLIMKALKTPSNNLQEKIEKAKVALTIPFELYLEKFFHIYGSDACALARLLGLEEPKEETEYSDDWYEDYIDSKIAGVEIMKSLHESENLDEAVSALDATDLLLLLTEQAKMENVFKSYDKKKGKKTSPKTKTQKETPMTVETVAKADHELVIKSLEEQKQALTKALASLAERDAVIAEHNKRDRELVEKARMGEITELVKNETHAETLYKSLEPLTDDAFVQVISVFKSVATTAEKIEKSSLFVELGASGDAVAPQSEASSALLKKALKARLSNTK